MADNSHDPQTLTRRSLILSAGGLGVFGVLSARLYQLQILRAEDYTALSENNRFNYHIIVPSRGRILDRNGEVLATNKQDYRVELISERIDDVDFTLDRIEEVVSLSSAARERIHADIDKHAKFTPVLIEDNLTWEDFAALNIRAPELPGVIPKVGEGRAYPYEGVFCHVLGKVGKVEQGDIDDDPDPLLRQPTFRIGKEGVERGAESRLRGKSGRLKVEVNAVGRIVREWPEENNKAEPGEDVWLTIDAKLQKFAAEQFGEDVGSLVVIDALTGEIRTMLSMPYYDGNQIVSSISPEDYEKLANNPLKPFLNRAIKGGYQPASTFKMCVMLAALETGKIDLSERIICTGHMQIGKKKKYCWHRRGGHGPVNLHESLQYSCDVFYYELAHRVEIDAVHSAALRLGLGRAYELGIHSKDDGLIPSQAYSLQRHSRRWRLGDSLNVFIGQGEIKTTPLQLAVMAARLANGRKAVNPSLVIENDIPSFAELDIDPNYLRVIQEAMFSVCMVPGGTAYRAFPLGPNGVPMAGKTGTAQVHNISASERASGIIRNQDKDWQDRDHSLFVGYAPYDAPRFAVATVVEHGGSGSGRAANITRAVLQKALEHDGLIEPVAELDTSIGDEL